MASLGSDGKPDLNNFVNLIKSRNNYLLIKQYTDKGAAFRDNELTALKKQDRVLVPADVEKIAQREDKYDLVKLAEELGSLVSSGQISADEKNIIIESVQSDPRSLGKKIGSKMKIIKPLLEKARSHGYS